MKSYKIPVSKTKGVLLMLLAASFAALGQLFWKLGIGNYYWLILGTILYLVGAISMIKAYKWGDLSLLHPIMSFSYVLALFLGFLVFNEPITCKKVLGVAFILAGIVCLGRGAMND